MGSKAPSKKSSTKRASSGNVVPHGSPRGKPGSKVKGRLEGASIDVRIDELGRYGIVAYLIALVLLVLMQGGYYPSATLVVGAVCCVALIPLIAKRRSGSLITSLTLFTVGALALVSMVANGLGLSSVPFAMVWFVVAALSLFPALASRSERAWGLRVLGWIVVASAVLGVAVFSGALPLEGCVWAGRLQFTFQYANAAGIWFAAGYVLCATSDDERLVKVACLPSMALLLTLSVGSLACFALAIIFLVVWCVRHDDACRAFGIIADAVVAGLVYGGCSLAGDAFVPLFALIGIAVRILADGSLHHVSSVSPANLRIAWIVVAVVFLIAVVCFVFLSQDRLSEAGQTFLSRLIQMRDGLVLLAGSPLLGIGPNAWDDAYHLVQSAQYTTSVVHCGYLQIALDAGAIALVAFTAMIVVCFRGLVKKRLVGPAVAAAVLIAHAVFDFDLRFSSLLLLLLLLLSCGLSEGEIREKGKVGKSAGKAHAGAEPHAVAAMLLRFAPIPLCAIGLVAALAGIAAGNVISNAEQAAETGDWQQVEEARGNPLSASDHQLKACHWEALLRAGECELLWNLVEQEGVDDSGQALLAAQCALAIGCDNEGADILLQRMELEPRNASLYETASDLLADADLDGETLARYRQAVERANELADSGVAALLDDQKRFQVPDGEKGTDSSE